MCTQVAELCNPGGAKQPATLNFEYKAGSIDGLIRFVKSNKFSTLLPYLSTLDFFTRAKATPQSVLGFGAVPFDRVDRASTFREKRNC